jgi:hypothetical protein
MPELWTDWPQRDIDGLMKGYMLAQWSSWIQQILVVSIEAHRKDYWQMIVHHFVTITLIATSYAYHHTRAGNLILVLMDIVDLILPVSHLKSHERNRLISKKACQMSEIPWLHNYLRYHFWPVSRCLASITPCFLPHDLLERLLRRASTNGKRLLPRQRGEPPGPVSGPGRLVASA